MLLLCFVCSRFSLYQKCRQYLSNNDNLDPIVIGHQWELGIILGAGHVWTKNFKALSELPDSKNKSENEATGYLEQ